MPTELQPPRTDVTAWGADSTPSSWLTRLLEDVEQETAPRQVSLAPPNQVPRRLPHPFAYDSRAVQHAVSPWCDTPGAPGEMPPGDCMLHDCMREGASA
jgi:hypothetical protein